MRVSTRSLGYARTLAVAVILCVLPASGADPPPLEWRGVTARYARFDQISPMIVNKSDTSVFFSRIWPHGSAQLERFDERSGKWERGRWSIACGTVSDATVPIELPGRAERQVSVFWQLSADDWDSPKRFVIESGDTRDLHGRYRLVLRYSAKPWTIVHRPGAVYVSISPEFSIMR